MHVDILCICVYKMYIYTCSSTHQLMYKNTWTCIYIHVHVLFSLWTIFSGIINIPGNPQTRKHVFQLCTNLMYGRIVLHCTYNITVHVYIRVHILHSSSKYMYMYSYTGCCTCTCIYIYIYIHVHVYIVYACMHIYNVHVLYMYIHACIYDMYMYTCTCTSWQRTHL